METIAVIVGTILVVLVAWLKGKDAGEAKTDKQVLKDAEKAAEVDRNIDRLDADAKRDRLRKH